MGRSRRASRRRARGRPRAEAWEAQRAIELESAGSVEAVDEAMHASEKHEGRSENHAAVVTEARTLFWQVRAVAVEQVRAVAEDAEEAEVEPTESIG